MAVIRLYANLRRIVNARQVEVRGKSVREVLDRMCRQYVGLGPALWERNGRLRQHIRDMVNGHDIELDRGLDTTINDMDQIAIFPPVAGG